MTKQIKYRFWNTIGRFFEQSDKISVNKDGDLVLYDYETGEWSIVKIENTCLVIDQFTNLKDKNGKEIYEGDIITCGNTYPKWVIQWNELTGTWRANDYSFNTNQDFSVNTNTITIIGNIHETPELLEW